MALYSGEPLIAFKLIMPNEAVVSMLHYDGDDSIKSSSFLILHRHVM